MALLSKGDAFKCSEHTFKILDVTDFRYEVLSVSDNRIYNPTVGYVDDRIKFRVYTAIKDKWKELIERMINA